MGLAQAIKTVFSKYATFRGVAPRSEYWWWALFTGVTSQVLSSIAGSLSPDRNNPTTAGMIVGSLGALFALATLIPGIAVTVRRFHDAGFSGKWLLLYIIPAISFLLVAGAAIAAAVALFDASLAADQKSKILFALMGVAALPVILSFAVGVFMFIVTLLPSKSAEAGNKHAK